MKEPWFQEGLRFKCTGCGKCCTGASGYVFLSPQDVERLTQYLQLSEEEFKERYTRMVDGQLSLRDAPTTDACIFLKEKACSVYEARPIQCRTFPWWLHTLQSLESWKEAAKDCEGIEHVDSPLVPALTIARECTTYLDNLIEQNFGFDPARS